MQKNRSASFVGIGLLLAGLSVSSMARANTAVPTARGFGPDDFNVSTLKPYPAKFLFTKGFVDKAKNTPNDAGQTPFENWDFQFVDEAYQLGSNDLKVATYQAWAVTNDPVKDPGGTPQSRPIVDQDAGGADFAATYRQVNSGSPPADTIHFLQVYSATRKGSFGQDSTTQIDNDNGSASPFYDTNGGDSHIYDPLTDGKNKTSWMFDIVAACENGLNPETGSCFGLDQDETLTYAAVTYEMFVAVPSLSDPTMVNLYGGYQWGYVYTASDVPEPASLALLGTGLLGIMTRGRRRHETLARPVTRPSRSLRDRQERA